MTQAVVDVYRSRREDEKRLFRRKKKEQERRECESTESSRRRNEARNFYQRVKRLTQGLKTGAMACRDDDGNLVTEAEVVLRCIQLLGYADDIDIIGRTNRDVTGAFGAIEKESAKVGLALNMEKTKFMLCSSRESRRLENQLTAENYSFGSVKEFIYLGTAITSTNDVSLEIKRRITLANKCYFGLSRQFNSRALSRRTKTTLYKTLILPVLLYGAECWTVTQTDAAALGVRVKSQRLRWLGHVARMDEDAPARKVFDAVIVGTRRRGRPLTRWQDQVMETLSTLGVTNWRRRAQDRDAWRHIALQAETR
nr:uncharacterized protein LOC122321356 [Drosophila bipectinata]